ncbi:MAG: TnpV protein [Clostridia bacterium]|nr:TnpV protein [Clostridia bacterium]
MNIQYRKEGDYYIPDLEIPASWKQPLGKYGRMRRAFLEKEHPGLYARMILNGTMWDHLAEIDRAAQERLDTILPEIAKAAGVTEELKRKDQMRWVGLMNACKNQAEEIILDELIYRV